MIRRAATAAGIALAVLLLSACASPGTADPAGTVLPIGTPPAEPIVAARALGDAPDGVHAEATCGQLELDQGEELPAAAIACVDAALAAGEAAALAWSSPTVEGDPIVRFAVVEAGASTIAVHATTGFDRYGTPGWTRDHCVAIGTQGCA
ncbi:hypothetical protein [Agrococcus beijingensis]|uniref:hypothetical protein n=1 Tax=Agrococcus beijingensis TaxID=3068634 RepID=UPI002742724F|nr:hypothetical protein [Agrococcus sp. REN33]